jgi:hypothetical protein
MDADGNPQRNEISEELLEKIRGFRESLTQGERNTLDTYRWLPVEHEDTEGDEAQPPPGWTMLGWVTVDSGHIVISDPCNVDIARQRFEGDLEKGSWPELYQSFGNEWTDLGVIFQPGFGDGSYPIYGRLVADLADPRREKIRSVLLEFF